MHEEDSGVSNGSVAPLVHAGTSSLVSNSPWLPQSWVDPCPE